MREQEDICCTCKLDKPWGCNTSIKVKDVVKDVGVVGCQKYEQDEKKAKYYGPWHMPKAIKSTEPPSETGAERDHSHPLTKKERYSMTKQMICGKCDCKKWKHKFVGVIKLQVCTRCGNVMRRREGGE